LTKQLCFQGINQTLLEHFSSTYGAKLNHFRNLWSLVLRQLVMTKQWCFEGIYQHFWSNYQALMEQFSEQVKHFLFGPRPLVMIMHKYVLEAFLKHF
jgi:hypothetical protein